MHKFWQRCPECKVAQWFTVPSGDVNCKSCDTLITVEQLQVFTSKFISDDLDWPTAEPKVFDRSETSDSESEAESEDEVPTIDFVELEPSDSEEND